LLDKTYIAESNTNIKTGLTLDQYIAVNKPLQSTPLTTAQIATLTSNYQAYQAAGTWNGVSQQNRFISDSEEHGLQPYHSTSNKYIN
jgi:hypothetical protein